MSQVRVHPSRCPPPTGVSLFNAYLEIRDGYAEHDEYSHAESSAC